MFILRELSWYIFFLSFAFYQVLHFLTFRCKLLLILVFPTTLNHFVCNNNKYKLAIFFTWHCFRKLLHLAGFGQEVICMHWVFGRRLVSSFRVFGPSPPELPSPLLRKSRSQLWQSHVMRCFISGPCLINNNNLRRRTIIVNAQDNCKKHDGSRENNVFNKSQKLTQ